MKFETCRSIPADHPSLAGHFPGAPIVPAVVVLDEVAAALAKWRPEVEIIGIEMAKFLAPVRPGQALTILFEADTEAAGHVDVTCRIDDRTLVQGRLLIRRRPS
jgi:3-hydroxymyristoyl/3-hydroxydecanoyl-(acyl carrier protein) dehydratase